MKRLNLMIILLIAIIFTGCSSTSTKQTDNKTSQYSKNHALAGKASWYGRDYHGRLTASGEKYNMRKLTAAHKTLPFGTIVRVTNTTNNKSVDVKINDRGPFVPGRVIDLSPKAFNEIASTNQGVVPVRIAILDDSNTFRYKH